MSNCGCNSECHPIIQPLQCFADGPVSKASCDMLMEKGVCDCTVCSVDSDSTFTHVKRLKKRMTFKKEFETKTREHYLHNFPLFFHLFSILLLLLLD